MTSLEVLACLTHFRFLLIEARKSDFGRNLLQGQVVSINSNSDSLTIEETCQTFNMRFLTRLTCYLLQSTKVQRKMLNGRSDESREVVRKKDDRRKRDGIVWKKNSEHSRWTESYADGAIYVVSADTVFVTKEQGMPGESKRPWERSAEERC